MTWVGQWLFIYNTTGMIHGRNNWWIDFIKIKNICSVKETFKRIKREATDWKKKSAKDTSQKGLLPKYTKGS